MTDRELSKLTKLIENKLLYYHFFEADKSRFIKPLFDTYKDLTPYSLDEMLEFFKKHNEVRIDWTQKDKEKLFLELVNIMGENEKKIEQKNEEKKNYREKDAKKLLRSNPEFIVIDELENDKWVFACPISWEGAKFADSAECGGVGAKWCIGDEKNEDFWNEHILLDKNCFVLALRKDFYKNCYDRNDIKYMLQIKESDFDDDKIDIFAWNQQDKKLDESDFFHKDFGDNEEFKVIIPIFRKNVKTTELNDYTKLLIELGRI